MTTTEHTSDENPSGQPENQGSVPLPPAGWVAVPVRYPRVSAKAIVALVLAVGGLLPVSLVLGYQARREIDRAGGELAGRWVATAAIWVSWCLAAVIVSVIGLVWFVNEASIGVVCAGSNLDC
ncbi:hypothetical protein DSM112329_02933 [Paraconexibacter sp. AEG42_29]|uniref:DUF4190 domain-containing protein n=1 Tax=Paraconexibacter sp. AEG42_29 TaxID=2997339 RepID=A0AAU7AWP8_9ACTN